MENDVCSLKDCQDGMTFGNIIRRPRDGLFPTCNLPYSRHKASNNARGDDDAWRCKMGTTSVGTAVQS